MRALAGLRSLFLVVAGTACAAPAPWSPPAAQQTVCTITVNSPDEAAAFRRALPADRYRFVELVERGRDDWLASACRRDVRCDVLVISGHYDGEGMFFSDQVDRAEHLPVRELERAACSGGCAGLFANLKQVYLFGCNTLAASPVNGTMTPVSSVDVATGAAPPRALSARHAESSRDRMARIFAHVPVIYGFASTAPLGPAAGGVLARWLRSGGSGEVAAIRPSERLLAHFAEYGLATTRGIGEGDPRMAHRRDVCRFEDERMSTAQRLAFVRELLARPPREVRVYLDPLERVVRGLDDAERAAPDVAAELDAIARDEAARERLLAYARDLDDAPLHARLVALARGLGWLDEGRMREAWAALLARRLATGAKPADVDLACRLGRDGFLASESARLRDAPGEPAAREAMLACVGDAGARSRVLAALTAARNVDVEMAQVVLNHQPLRDAAEFRALADAIARMDAGPDAQARALEALARQPVVDAQGAAALAGLFPSATLAVQRAIAGVLLRADLAALDAVALGRLLRQHRLRSPEGRDLIDVLLRRLGADDQRAALAPGRAR